MRVMCVAHERCLAHENYQSVLGVKVRVASYALTLAREFFDEIESVGLLPQVIPLLKRVVLTKDALHHRSRR